LEIDVAIGGTQTTSIVIWDCQVCDVWCMFVVTGWQHVLPVW